MNPIVIIASLLAAFVAGVVVAKYVISETQSIKEHVTAEIAEMRADVASLLSKAAAKL